MKAVIFGVNGQAGSYLSELLLGKGYEVIGVKRRSSNPSLDRIGHINSEKFSIVEGDITDYCSVYECLKVRPDEIYNLAAMSHVGSSFTQPLHTVEVDTLGQLNILECVKNLGSGKVFFAATSEMFGDRFDSKNGIQYQNEQTSFNPRSPYGIAKVAAFQFTKLYRECYGLFTSSGIMFNYESPRRGEEFVTRKITKYLGELCKRWKAGDIISKPSSLKLYDIFPVGSPNNQIKLKLGNLDAKRDWGHCADTMRAVHLMLNHHTPMDFVISTGVTRSVREFCDISFSLLGLDYRDYVEIDPKFLRPCEVPYLNGDSTLAREVLGWSPQISFNELVEEMVRSDVDKRLGFTSV
mgnify:CR=1 FL=1